MNENYSIEIIDVQSEKLGILINYNLFENISNIENIAKENNLENIIYRNSKSNFEFWSKTHGFKTLSKNGIPENGLSNAIITAKERYLNLNKLF